MPMETICSAGASSVLTAAVYPILALASTFTALIIGLSYMLGQATSNPKLTLWAKTESIQLVVSAVVCVLILSSVTAFCSIDLLSIFSFFNLSGPAGSDHFSIYDGAERYFVDSGLWIKSLLNSARYHIGAYNLLSAYGRGTCGEGDGSATVFFMCMFGGALGGGVGYGTNSSPDSGYGYIASAVGVAFNSIVFSFISSLNYYIILKFIYSGLPFFLLPLGIFLRAMPYLRSLGSVLMLISFCFLTVYPLVLSLFYIDLIQPYPILKPCPEAMIYSDESIEGKVNWWDVISVDNSLHGDVFSISSSKSDIALCRFPIRGGSSARTPTEWADGEHGDFPFQIIQLAGTAFLAGVFIPSLALLAAAGAVAYLNRFLGEEIDLSRIVQMV